MDEYFKGEISAKNLHIQLAGLPTKDLKKEPFLSFFQIEVINIKDQNKRRTLFCTISSYDASKKPHEFLLYDDSRKKYEAKVMELSQAGDLLFKVKLN